MLLKLFLSERIQFNQRIFKYFNRKKEKKKKNEKKRKKKPHKSKRHKSNFILLILQTSMILTRSLKKLYEFTMILQFTLQREQKILQPKSRSRRSLVDCVMAY